MMTTMTMVTMMMIIQLCFYIAKDMYKVGDNDFLITDLKNVLSSRIGEE